MKLKDFLEVLAVGMPYTIGIEFGQGWIAYYDGEKAAEISEAFLDRTIVNIYPRKYREKGPDYCELKAGLGIILVGYENGTL